MSITNRISNRELWESWNPTPSRIESGLAYYVLTPMGYGVIHQEGETGRWVVKPCWNISQYHAENEEQAIYLFVEFYLQAEKRVLEAYISGLKVNLGLPDEHGYVWTPAGGYTIRRGVVRIDLARGLESTGEIQTRDVYVLSYRGRVLETNPDFHVWEDKITEAFQYELMEALNLRKDEYE